MWTYIKEGKVCFKWTSECCGNSGEITFTWRIRDSFIEKVVYLFPATATSVVSDAVRPQKRQPTRLPRPWILQARTLAWVAISFSNAWKWKVKVKSLSHVWLLATPWTAAYQAPLSMGFSRREYWSGVPLPSPKMLRKPVTKFNIHLWY